MNPRYMEKYRISNAVLRRNIHAITRVGCWAATSSEIAHYWCLEYWHDTEARSGAEKRWPTCWIAV